MLSLELLARQLVEREGSDLHIAAGSPPMMRIDGRLLPAGDEKLSAEATRKLVYGILNSGVSFFSGMRRIGLSAWRCKT